MIVGFWLMLGLDLLAVLCSVALARYLRWLWLDYPDVDLLLEWDVALFLERLWLFGILGTLMVCAFAYLGHYTKRRLPVLYLDQIILTVLLIGVADFASAYLLQKAFPRLWVMLTWGILPFALVLGRYLTIWLLKKMQLWKLPILFVGDDKGLQIANGLMGNDQFSGYTIVQFFVEEGEEACVTDRSFLKLNLTRPWRVLICYANSKNDRAELMAVEALRHGHQVMLLPAYYRLPVYHSQIEPIFGEHYLLMRLQNSLDNYSHRFLKRAQDLLCVGLLLVVSAPVLICAILWIASVSKGPIFFKQKRVGQNGKIFTCFKLRTMEDQAHRKLIRWKTQNPQLWENYESNNFKLCDDPRLIKGGRFLRAFSIDELPQLINILKGDMSFVGPRPILPREMKSYGDEIENYIRVLPGLTGLWQVNGRSYTTFTKRAEIDSWYIQNWSVWLDVIIIVKTIKVILLGQGERKKRS